MKNKKGVGGMTMFISMMLAVVVILGILAVTGVFQSVTGESQTEKIIASTGCNIAPSVNLLATNTLVAGTTPTIASNTSIYNGDYVGTVPTSLTKGGSLEVMATASGYLNDKQSISSIQCDSNDLKFALTPYLIPTLKVTDDGFNTLTDNAVGGAVNQSSSANQIVETLKITGSPDKTTADMLVIVEYANKTEVASSKISLSGADRVATNPNWYTPAGVNSATASFKISAIVDGGSKSLDLTFNPESGQTMGASGTAVYVTVYTLNPVILDSQTGKFLTENTWSDTLGADKTIANVDYDFFII